MCLSRGGGGEAWGHGAAHAYLGNSWSRNCWALEKAGWVDIRVEMWGTFPPGKAGTMDAATFASVPPWRLASCRPHVG